MHTQPGSDVSLSSLSQYRSRLSAAQADVSLLNRELTSGLAFFELARHQAAAPESEDISQPDLGRAILMVLDRPAGAPPTLKDLKDVYQSLTGEEPALRSRQEPPLFGQVAVTPAALIERAVGRFFEWVASDGYRELHPIEQLVIGQMRLLEIQPFGRYSRLSGNILSYSFLAGAGCLVPSYSESDLKKFDGLLTEALSFSTRGLVGLHVEACKRSYQWALQEIEN